MRVKVCGITDPADAVLAAELGASAIGLVFWPSSPRSVSVERARHIVSVLPPFVSTVGVFVDQIEDARAIAADVRLSAVQLHGDERPDDYRDFPVPVIKAVAVWNGSSGDLTAAIPPNVTVLLDTHDPVRRGGTGQVIDWTVAADIARRRAVVLSGGLNQDNVARAVAAVRPWAVDVSSGVESAPGKKDPARLRAFFAALGHGVHETR
jgi:phosphoribosylanthranilate isomerase